MVKKAEKITQQARIDCERWRSYWSENINQYHAFHEFVLGRQWTDDEEDTFTTNKKVAMTFNKLATLANTILGEQQQNTPQIQVVPLDNCNEETARLRELIVKDISLGTDAKTVYQVAASQMIIGGFGAFVVATDYLHDKSFELDICFRAIKDATRAYWDVSAERINKTDGMFAGYLSRMSRRKFRSIYGKTVEENISSTSKIYASEEEVSLATDPNSTNNVFNWADDEGITIMDHFVRKYESTTLYKMSNGKTVTQEELDELIEKSREINRSLLENQLMTAGYDDSQIIVDAMPQEDVELMTLWDEGRPIRIDDKRETKRHKIKHYKIAGDYVLDETDFPSDQLPVVFMDNNSYYDKDGKQKCRSFFQDVRDAQRYLNYLATQSAYMLKISRYDQFMASKKNVQGLDTQQIWRDPSVVQGTLFYDESPSGTRPEQLRPPELSQSLLTQYQRAMEDLYTSTGLYPTKLGQQGNEISGAAIDARTKQGSYTTYTVFNSINRAISVGGEIVNEMIPRVYDTERVISIMSPDRGQENITINQQLDEYGERVKNDIRKGTYQVRLQAGPSYEGQKQQALESLNMVLQANPQLLNLFADLYAENLPLMNTIEIKNRLKTIVPPQIIEAGKTGKMPQEQGPQQPDPQQQLMEMQQQMAEAELQLKQKEIELKQQEIAMKAQQMNQDAEIEMARLETERLEVAAQLEEQKLRYLAETDRTRSDESISHADNLTKILTHKI